ncbi:MAG TPA: hypothetical protein VGN42_24050 [Pirellulales bacterium]|nr:hypothetical protein [Pirellulales bacterium]
MSILYADGMATDLPTPAPPRRLRRPKRLRAKPKPSLSIAQILAWADEFFEQHGRWPTLNDGRIRGPWDETWGIVDCALRAGSRDLKKGSSLARLLCEHRGVRNRSALPPHTVEQILAWADAYRLRTGRWPVEDSGPVAGAPGETWSGITAALQIGARGLPGGSSLAKLLAEHRGVRYKNNLQGLTIPQVLAWADAYRERTGRWPTADAGAIPESAGDAWLAIDAALRKGRRGLPSGQSLARLLCEHRGVRNHKGLPPYAERQILAWADAYYQSVGVWPTLHSGPIAEAPGETWHAVDAALQGGCRGLPGGSSLALLLLKRRGVRHRGRLPRFSVSRILAWARVHRRRTGKYPTNKSGPVGGSPGDTWLAVDMALSKGLRGLPGGSSLAKLLAERLGVRSKAHRKRLAIPEILVWVDAYHARTGRWPTKPDGTIPESAGDSWHAVDSGLRNGLRGLPGGSSLARLLQEHRGARNSQALVPLTERQILAWADAYFQRVGAWPTSRAGPIADASGEKWSAVDTALRSGCRGLRAGSSLALLLLQQRRVRHKRRLPRFSETRILAWARAHRRRTGKSPTRQSGPVVDSPGDTWSAVDAALLSGLRGLPGGSSLAKILQARN